MIKNKMPFVKTITQMASGFTKLPITGEKIKMALAASGSFLSRHKMHLGFVILAILIPLLIRFLVWQSTAFNPKLLPANETIVNELRTQWERELATSNKKLQARQPRSYYLLINSASNEFELRKGSALIKKDKCSTGSYILLKNGDQQQWMFKTPKGEFRIQGKTTAPVWKKPDWAFVEEGLPVPSANHHSRFEYGVLGDYALSLGHGYLIHGTLYQRFLGLPVTHGCIRLNDKNLELVYQSLSIGSKVYIY